MIAENHLNLHQFSVVDVGRHMNYGVSMDDSMSLSAHTFFWFPCRCNQWKKRWGCYTILQHFGSTSSKVVITFFSREWIVQCSLLVERTLFCKLKHVICWITLDITQQHVQRAMQYSWWASGKPLGTPTNTHGLLPETPKPWVCTNPIHPVYHCVSPTVNCLTGEATKGVHTP